MAAGDRIFMAKESTSQEILSNTKKIIEDAKAKPKRYGMRINLLDSNPATRVKYAEFQNMEIVNEYSDEGKSGKSVEGRPEFQRMLDNIENGTDEVQFV